MLPPPLKPAFWSSRSIELTAGGVVIALGLNLRDATGSVSIVVNGILFSAALHYK